MSENKLLNPIGIRVSDGVAVLVSQVESGLKCECICPECKKPLVARKGDVEKKIHHFAHYNENKDGCNYAYETGLHVMAKQILADSKEIKLPIYIPTEEAHKRIKVFLGKNIPNVAHDRRYPLHPYTSNIENCRIENNHGNIRPDIIVDTPNGKLFIEIAVTHFVDKQKEAKIVESGISTIEIDLSGISREISHEELSDTILLRTHNKKWIYNSGHEFIYCSYMENLLTEIEEKRKIEKEKEREKQKQIKLQQEEISKKYDIRRATDRLLYENKNRIIEMTSIEVLDRKNDDLKKSTKIMSLWDKQVKDIKDFFTSFPINKEAIRIAGHLKITDMPKFINSHIRIIEHTQSYSTFQPYMDRLVELKQILAKLL